MGVTNRESCAAVTKNAWYRWNAKQKFNCSALQVLPVEECPQGLCGEHNNTRPPENQQRDKPMLLIFIQPPTWSDLTQGHFNVGTAHELTHARRVQKKKAWSFCISRLGRFRYQAIKLAPPKRVLPRGMALWNQAIQINNTQSARTLGKAILLMHLKSCNVLSTAISNKDLHCKRSG